MTDNRVLCESVAFALDALGFDSNQLVWPDLGAPDEDSRRRALAGNPKAGLLFGDLRGPHRLADAVKLVDDLPLRWLMVVGDPRERTWAPFVDSGASAIVPSSLTLDRLARTLLQVMSADQAGHRVERDRLMTEWRTLAKRRDEAVARFASLSPREVLVLDRLYEGISVKNIAEIDGVSEATVRTQVKAVLRKLDVSSQLAPVAEYRRVKGDGGQTHRNGDGRSAGVPTST